MCTAIGTTSHASGHTLCSQSPPDEENVSTELGDIWAMIMDLVLPYQGVLTPITSEWT